MNRRTALSFLPHMLAATAALAHGAIVPALAADAKQANVRSANGSIELLTVWARASKARETTAYLDIVNHGANDDRLIAVSTPLASQCVIMKTKWRGLTLTPVKLETVELPSMGRVRFRPGGTYIHILDASQSLANRTEMPLTFTFADAGQVDVVATMTPRLLGPVE